VKFTEDLAEQTTAATDIILALVAGASVLFLRGPELNNSQLWKVNIWSGAFGLIGLAAVLGAVAHGLVLSQSLHHRIWRVLNLALALAISLFVVAVVYDLWGSPASLTALPVMLIAGATFYLVTLLYPGIFFLFIVYEALSLVFALSVYVFLAIRGELPGAGWMAVGILLSILAAGIQANKSVRVAVIWEFDHNGIYHLVQTVGLFFLAAGLKLSLIS
jgi:hypothetical protein